MDLLTLQPTTRAEVAAIKAYGASHSRDVAARATLEILEIKVRDREWPTRKNGESWRSFEAKPRLYTWPEDYNVLGDLLSGTRRDRPEQEFKPAFLALLRKMTGDPGLKLVWSQKAGCSCGCSPAFIITTRSGKLRRQDVSIKYTLKAAK